MNVVEKNAMPEYERRYSEQCSDAFDYSLRSENFPSGRTGAALAKRSLGSSVSVEREAASSKQQTNYANV